MTDQLKNRNFEPEFTFSTSRSSGPGGQHVNKTETKVELRFNIPSSEILTDEEKNKLLKELANRINTEGDLIISSQEHKSQSKNKEETIEKFYELIAKALTPKKKRKRTKPSKAAWEKRLKQKKMQSEKKQQRKPPEV
ncbi:MAG: aminoacyl-tRNA hydrolase [Bacteroidales bacterium]|nr:aminoacyl-tRNA hydrolase [Bacteroidales bacterium]MCF8350584.1 aminoacyl-tRNA hydrolase [Bacteroidales bacterium]MCF8377248.1 aminoacyl-tRNA hydrolase [Bacteroidales bacterium]MCF8401994.1 aminoacyl-tRNA hydrolase [Bacteroidales bacterium]